MDEVLSHAAAMPAPARATWAWRAVLVRVHRVFGLCIAGFLGVAGLTGSLMAFGPELDAWLNPQLWQARDAGPPLAPEALLARVQAQRPGLQVTFMPVRALPGQAWQLGVRGAGHRQLFVEPASGRVLGERQLGTWRLDRVHALPFITRLHYSLFLPDRWGLWLMGAVALVWLFDTLLALLLTLPRGQPFWPKWRPAWQVQRRRLHFDWHRASGLWLWGLLLVMAISSVYLNLRQEVFKPVVQWFSPLTPSPFERRVIRPASDLPLLGPDQALALAREAARAQGLDTPVGTLSHRADRGYYLALLREDPHTAGPGLGSPRLYLDDRSGALIPALQPGQGGAGDVFSQLQFPLHSGQIAGWPGRLLVCVVGLATALLSFTGLLVWWRKRRARRQAAALLSLRRTP